MEEINSLINKVLLVGITLIDKDNNVLKQIQVHGNIVRVSSDGISIINNNTNKEFTIPADFENITEASPGEYKLRSTGEVVIDPDYISSWTVHNADENSVDLYESVGFGGYEPA
ncbi:hypothetical protein [endosymbiont of Riftia pachyptila]|uniref:hypothetical protein n=1 Tax=endosymbiont of Riftia pachyptila TaxID=54396 RepID=UPI001112036F|nr:hypothetical protein [endosymbiont of Riftia pachyptila]